MKYLLILSIIVCNACYGQNGKRLDSMMKVMQDSGWATMGSGGTITMPIDTGQTTIGIITSKKGQDTVKVYATIKNTTTNKTVKAIIYQVQQKYKWTEHNTPDSEPQYFFKHIKYLGQDKKELPKNITVIKATELK